MIAVSISLPVATFIVLSIVGMTLFCHFTIGTADCTPRESVMRNLSVRLFVMRVDGSTLVIEKHSLTVVDIIQ